MARLATVPSIGRCEFPETSHWATLPRVANDAPRLPRQRRTPLCHCAGNVRSDTRRSHRFGYRAADTGRESVKSLKGVSAAGAPSQPHAHRPTDNTPLDAGLGVETNLQPLKSGLVFGCSRRSAAT